MIIDEEYIIKLRRYFHKYPEESMKEYLTSKKIKKELDILDIEYEDVGETGVVGYIGDKNSPKKIALRADIDALEITENNKLSYKSAHKGLMHACGHDGHIASLLGAAKYLKKNENQIKGCIKLCFQQGEEIGEGGKIFLEKGFLDDVKASFGIHLASDINLGQIAIKPGPVTAACDYIKVEIFGESAHVSTPEKGVDALYIASNIIVTLQSVISRLSNPLNPILLGIGKLNSGTRYNVVSNYSSFEGTLRSLTDKDRSIALERIKSIVNYSTKQFGAKSNISIKKFASPVYNDKELTKFTYDIFKDIVGNHNIIKDRKPSLGADDFSEFQKKSPGIYAYVGSKSSRETSYPHHHENFNIDEESLIISSKLYIKFAEEYLNLS